jgi:hypothetical protein
MSWPQILIGKSTQSQYTFIGSFTVACARYQGPYGIVYITEQDLKDKNWIAS